MSSYFCIVCFYNSEMDGKFGVDYIFHDMKTALTSLKMYNETLANLPNRKCWPAIYATKLPPIGDDEYYVYLDQSKKRLHISAYPVEDSPFNGRRIALPMATGQIPTIEDVKLMVGIN